MTERKPPGMTFTSWIDQQIYEATQRGEFDDLPGAGKPLPQHPDEDGQRWLREYLRREGVSADELLPPPLKLRKERARLIENVTGISSEAEVREAVTELNHRIAEFRRIPVGPPIFVPLLDADEMVARWRAARASSAPPVTPASELGQSPAPEAEPSPSRRRWWRLGR
jgi:DnaJ homologue, subfamily C, member 28, conserved domain